MPHDSSCQRAPEVSVIIPTYGHQRWVIPTLHSVLEQTFTDYEIIVVNDGSPDDTAKLLRPYAEDGHIRYIEQSNSGQSAARNVGIANARGKFVAFLDDDDLWPADKLAWQVDILSHDTSIGVVAGIAEIIDETDRTILSTSYVEELSFSAIFRHCPITSPGQTLIRRSLLDQVGGLDETVAGVDDWDLWFKLSACSRFVMRNRVALRYRRHGENASNNVERLYRAARVVAHRHAASGSDTASQAEFRRKAFHSLHTDTGWGRVIADKLKSDLKTGHWHTGLSRLSYLWSMWVGMGIADMPRNAIRDLAPQRVKHMLRSFNANLG